MFVSLLCCINWPCEFSLTFSLWQMAHPIHLCMRIQSKEFCLIKWWRHPCQAAWDRWARETKRTVVPPQQYIPQQAMTDLGSSLPKGDQLPWSADMWEVTCTCLAISCVFRTVTKGERLGMNAHSHHIRTGLSAYNPKKVVGEINTLSCWKSSCSLWNFGNQNWPKAVS